MSLFLGVACGSSSEVRSLAAASSAPPTRAEIAALRAEAYPLRAGQGDPLSPILDWVGDARFVLLGEASHGTQEFYELRAELTKALIERAGLDAVAIEGDWPSARRVDRYVRGHSSDASAAEALADFGRFPGWMWRNEVVAEFVDWLRAYNEALPSDDRKVGFYGLDVYSPAESAAAVAGHLEARSHSAAERARERYACLLDDGDEPSAMMGNLAVHPDCLGELKTQLSEVQRLVVGEDALDAAQNAHVVADAGRYWAAQLTGVERSWNVRDTHMAETMDRITESLDGAGEEPARIAVWAHNSHLGDARATERSERGEHNLGQLLRERHGEAVFNLGFSTHRGVVTAAHDWGLPSQRKRVRPGRADSYEGLLHSVALPAFALRLADPAVRAALATPRLSRAIGVIYRPETELQSHYFETRLPEAFDALIHIDETTALRPLNPEPSWQAPTSSS